MSVLSPDQSDALVRTAADFARNEIAPRVEAYDLAETLPRDLLAKMSALGLYGGVISEANGGLGLDFVTFSRVVEEISKVCNAMGCLISMPSGLVGASIERFGTAEQKQQWLVPLAQG